MENEKRLNYQKFYYFSKIREDVGILIICLLISVLCVLITYPGILYSDSFARIATADSIIFRINQMFHGGVYDSTISSWLTLTPSIFIALSKLLTGNIAFYTFTQAFLFFSVTYFFIKRISFCYKKIQYILFAICPMIWCVSIYYEAGIGCVTGICALVLILDNIDVEKSRTDTIIEYMLIVFFSFVTFGYRANAFTIIPVLLAFIITTKTKVKIKILSVSMIFIGILFTSIVPLVLNINTMSSVSAGFVWEVLTSIQSLEPEKQELYSDYFDDIGGAGSTIDALQRSDEKSVNGFIWYSKLNNYVISSGNSPKIILEKYINFIVSEPKAYFQTKWNFILNSLGINKQLICSEYYYDDYQYDSMSNYQFNDSLQRMLFVKVYNKFNSIFGFYTCTPWVVFAISVVLFFISYIRKYRKRKLQLFVFLLSFFYYGAYLINTQFFGLRYFYPSLYLLTILNCSILFNVINDLCNWMKNKCTR